MVCSTSLKFFSLLDRIFFLLNSFALFLCSWRYFANGTCQCISSRNYSTLPIMTICSIDQGFSIAKTEEICSLNHFF